MATRVLVAVAILTVAGGAAVALRRRRPEPPVRSHAAVPAQLDRSDFARPEAPWLVVLFSSDRCASCRDAARKVEALASDAVAVEVVEFGADPERHDRYGIDAVPLVVVADGAGVSRASFAGAFEAADLWAHVATLRSDRDPRADPG